MLPVWVKLFRFWPKLRVSMYGKNRNRHTGFLWYVYTFDCNVFLTFSVDSKMFAKKNQSNYRQTYY